MTVQVNGFSDHCAFSIPSLPPFPSIGVGLVSGMLFLLFASCLGLNPHFGLPPASLYLSGFCVSPLPGDKLWQLPQALPDKLWDFLRRNAISFCSGFDVEHFPSWLPSWHSLQVFLARPFVALHIKSFRLAFWTSHPGEQLSQLLQKAEHLNLWRKLSSGGKSYFLKGPGDPVSGTTGGDQRSSVEEGLMASHAQLAGWSLGPNTPCELQTCLAVHHACTSRASARLLPSTIMLFRPLTPTQHSVLESKDDV